jgi:O-antigen/teichoic acid export membrane protein
MLKLPIRSLIVRGTKSGIASSTTIMVVGMGARLLLQMLTFLIVSRVMGAAQFGAFVTVGAWVWIISAFSGWGADQLIVKTVARVPSAFGEAFGSGLVFLGLSAPSLVLGAFLIVPFFVHPSISRGLILYMALADIAFFRVNVFAAACYQAVNQAMGTARLNLGFSGARLAGALLWIAVATNHDARSWAAYYCGASGFYAIISLLLVRRDLGPPKWSIAWQDWRDGFHFSLQLAVLIWLGNIDKAVVALFSNLSTAGIYGAAARLVDAAVVPVKALMYSTYAKFFELGAAGAHKSLKLAVRMLPVGVALGFVGTLGVLIVAPVTPELLGHGYVGASKTMAVLAGLPVFFALYSLAADVLVSSHHVGLRTLLQCIAPPLDVALCALLVPRYGAVGAAAASILSYVAMGAAAWSLAIFVSSGARRIVVENAELTD